MLGSKENFEPTKIKSPINNYTVKVLNTEFLNGKLV